MMEQLTFPIMAMAAIALWTVANCVGTWAQHLDNRIKLLQLQHMVQQSQTKATQANASSSDDIYNVDIIDEPGGVDILPEEPAAMQQAA
jgi:hypothetical protein